MANLPFFAEDLFGDDIEPPAAKKPTGHGCEVCLRYKSCQSPKMPVYGEGAKGILIISEFPSATDDERGTPLSGDSGAIMHRELRKHGIDVFLDCWTVHAIRCHLGTDWITDRKLAEQGHAVKKISGERGQATKHCSQKLLDDVRRLAPTTIIPLGPYAISGLLGTRLTGRMSGTQPTAFIGHQVPDQDLQAWVCPSNGTKYLLENQYKKDYQRFFQNDIEKAISKIQLPIPKAFSGNDVTLYWDVETATTFLRTVASGMDIAFDYETTGLKPHREGHEIWCASVAFGEQGKVRGHAFRFYWQDPEFIREWVRILTDQSIGKIAHNNQFEDTWSRVRGGGEWVDGWHADTCLDAHIIHNEDPTSLKFVTYSLFGIMGYDSEMDKYLRASEDGGNAFNKIKDAPLDKLLTYCGMDSVASREAQYVQAAKLREYPPNLRGSRFLLEASQELARASETGMYLDVEHMEVDKRQIAIDMEVTKARILSYDKVPKAFNPNASEQVCKLFYDVLGNIPGRGGRTAEAVSLLAIGTPLAMDVLEWKRMSKLAGTYIDGFLREAVSGIIHPSFSLNRVTTFRSSSQAPNFQNIPKRDPVAKKLVRTALRPSPGNVLIEADYKGVEVSIGYCEHHDKNMGAYLMDPKSDMHRDMCSKVFLLPPGDVKPYRGDTKMLATFAEFYGSKAEALGRARHGEVTLKIWDYLQVHPELLDHMTSKGIGKLDQLQEHLVAWEKDLWTNVFPGYAKWKEDIWAFYQQNLYVPLKTGFRCHGPLGFNDATNYPIQGPAFHCLLWTKKHVAPLIRGLSGRSAINGQIHDALVGDIHPDELEEVAKIIQDYGTRKLPAAWTWIDTPLAIEMEQSEVSGNWAEMKPLHVSLD